MHIRRLNSEDAAPFLELRLQALLESPTSFGSSFEEERDRSQAQVAQFLSGSSERAVIGAFQSEELIGIVGVGRETALKQRHIAFIRSMYVTAPSRGLRLGTALIAEALKVAFGWIGLQQLTLAVNASNASAIALYTRAGFVVFGRHPNALFVNGSYHDELHMVRQSAA
jgi:RimJ/RimL family protein N-acetyltransferase